jgi:hypothetical protein
MLSIQNRLHITTWITELKARNIYRMQTFHEEFPEVAEKWRRARFKFLLSKRFGFFWDKSLFNKHLANLHKELEENEKHTKDGIQLYLKTESGCFKRAEVKVS